MSKLIPHEFQDRGVEYGLVNPRTYYAVDMGLGKTYITLKLIETLKAQGKSTGALVIAPITPMYDTWPNEIKKWGMDLSYTILHGEYKLDRLHQKKDVYLVNYEGVQAMYDELIRMSGKKGAKSPFNVIVLDEASFIKDHSTNRFKLLTGLKALFPEYRYLLSGTPASNGYMNLWSQYDFLADGKALGYNITNYRDKHFDKHHDGFKYVLREGHEEEILDRVKPYTFRLDARDHIKLPDITYNEIKVDLSPKVKEYYRELEREFFVALEEVEVEVFNRASLSMKLRQFLQGSVYYTKEEDNWMDKPPKYTEFIHNEKVKALADIVASNPDKPHLVAINFRFEKDMIRKIFPDAKFIVGGMNRDVVNGYIKDWNAGKIPMLCAHPLSIGHGLNLQFGGNIVVWYGLTWSLEQYLQFNKRLHRQGQKEAVIIHHILMEGTIDMKIYRALIDKDITQQGILDYLREED